MDMFKEYQAISLVALGLLLQGCSKQSAEPMPESLRGNLAIALSHTGISLPSTVKLNDSFAPHHHDLIADISGSPRHALNTLTRELFHGSLMQSLAKDPPTLFAVPDAITFREAALVANMVVMQMRLDWGAQSASDQDPDAQYSRVLAGAIQKVAVTLRDPAILAALKARGIDINGMEIYSKVLVVRAATNDAGGDTVSRVKDAVKKRLAPSP